MHPCPPTAHPALADRLTRIIDALCDAVARRVGPSFIAGRLAGPLIILIRARLRRIAARFIRLATSPVEPSLSPSRFKAKHPTSKPPRPPDPLRGFASLLRLVPETAPIAAQLRHLLADPGMAALLATTPKLASTLRPLCRMLAIRVTQTLSLAPFVPRTPRRSPTPPTPPIIPFAFSMNLT